MTWFQPKIDPDGIGANVNLSNLESPTSINQSLLPENDSKVLGQPFIPWGTIYLGISNNFTIYSGPEKFIHRPSSQCIGIGTLTLISDNLIGAGNVAIGDSVLANCSSGTQNIGIGVSALQEILTGNNNLAIGEGTLQGAESADNCIALGDKALSNLQSGENNVAIGKNALRNLGMSKSGNVAIGAYAGQHEAEDNRLHIDSSNLGDNKSLIYGEFDNRIVKINGDLSADTFNMPNLITKTLYVDGNRTDSYTEDGSQFQPYKTIQAAITVATAISTIVIAPGIYTENLALKAGVYLRGIFGSANNDVKIIGKATYNDSGTLLLSGLYFYNTADHTLNFGGANAQKIRAYNCKFETNSAGSHHAINAVNTHANSEIQLNNCLLQVLNSSGGARGIETIITSQGSIGLQNVSVRIIDNTDNIAINLEGAIVYWHTMDDIQGRVIVATTASATISLCKLSAATQSVLITNSAGITVLSSVMISTAASPTITGAGAFAYAGVTYAAAGTGLAGTLNGGAGPTVGALKSESASNILCDNAISGLSATLVKTAIDELALKTQAGTANGQLTFWDNSAGTWRHTEIDEFFWDDTNKRLKLVSATKTLKIDPAARSIGTESNDDFFLFTFNQPRVTVTSDGNVGIGVTPTTFFHVEKSVYIGSVMAYFHNPTGGGGGVAVKIETESGNIAEALLIQNNGVGAGLRINSSPGDTSPIVFDDDGNSGFGTASPTAKVDINSDILRIRTSKTPASAAASGNQGDIAWDADYIYVCTATDTWKRSAIATW